MNPSVTRGTLPFRSPLRYSRFAALLLTLFFLNRFTATAQEKCNACSVPSFAALTVYHTLQTGPGMGIGIEAGKWKKDEGRFSYFLGTSMMWSAENGQSGKIAESRREMFLSFYWKGQYKVASRLYLIAQPELVNLSSFEMRTGMRYVFPITSLMGIGLEPGYSLLGRQWSLNTNIHFALR